MGANEFKYLRERFAEAYAIPPDELYDLVRQTCFKQKETKQDRNARDNGGEPVQITDAQITALLAVAHRYNLDPFTKELFAFPDKVGIIPIVSVDGWVKIINSHEDYDGVEFAFADELAKGLKGLPEGKSVPAWCEVTIYHKRRSRPLSIREYADEVYRPPFECKGQYGAFTVAGPWQSHPKRMMRHKTLIQGGRVAFGFGGLVDEDEARVIEMGQAEEVRQPEPARGSVYMPAALPDNPTQTAAEFFGGEPLAREREPVAVHAAQAPAASAAPVVELPKRRAGRPTRAEAEERRRLEAELAAQQAGAGAEPSGIETPFDIEDSTKTQLPDKSVDPRQMDAFDPSAGSRAQPASKAEPAGREPGSDDEPPEDSDLPPNEPVSASALKILERKLSVAGRTEVDLRAKFGFGFSGVTKRNWEEVNRWAASV